MESIFITPPIVLDTNVLVAGACRNEKSAAYRILMGILHKEIPLILTTSIALEYQDVLQRESIVALTGLNHRQSAELVTDLIVLSREVQIRFSWRPNLQDEGDNKFVEAAIHAGATIVTYDIRDYGAGDLTPHGWTWMTPHEFVTRYL